mgnify:FL=1
MPSLQMAFFHYYNLTRYEIDYMKRESCKEKRKG